MPNVTAFLDIGAARSKKPVMIIPATGESYTMGDLLNAASAAGDLLSSSGVRKGDRIVLYLGSSAGYLISYFAAWRIGAVAVPTNKTHTRDELLYAVTNSGSRFLITDPDGAMIAETIPGITILRIKESPGGTPAWPDTEGKRVYDSPVNCSPTDLCQIQYTSGTTGNPKGAMLTHGGWMAALDAEADVLALTADDVYLGIYPMGHVGISWGIAALKAGATFVVMERFDPERYLQLAEEYRVTILAGMPPVIHSLLDQPPGTEDRIRSVRAIISGGGPLHPGIWHSFYERFGIPIVNAYGLSETIVVGTGTAIRVADYPLRDQVRSVGHPVGYSEVSIVDTDDPTKTLPAGEEGEIALRGPAVALGYYGMEKETEEAFLPSGWFLTGDIGCLDPEGRLMVTDRKKDMIIMSGWKIYPTEVENILLRHPAIADAAVFGVPDTRRGEIPVAAVIQKEGVELAADEIRAFCRKHLAGYKVPRDIIIQTSLPRKNGWKLMRKTLREEYMDQA
ncbi:MAG: acyl-CoA synthetase [Methanocalculus sp. MSAO_Arc1]|uniref:class I adenylate-forming enzyme family protein n=1 Tax=Methanocalculus TaxID=71151 RepID=UPI000FF6131E|nr:MULTISPECIES: AMP-binding protein [unclassified Methanocalculus]MCP1662874.1 long-chain acyl-CoA synthetase [Methanocalculus sp. AMF5]RQD82070.1 MAG: acyl-CoA synthetase [Methanocalculus sp. MSAO_Arc1]